MQFGLFYYESLAYTYMIKDVATRSLKLDIIMIFVLEISSIFKNNVFMCKKKHDTKRPSKPKMCAIVLHCIEEEWFLRH